MKVEELGSGTEAMLFHGRGVELDLWIVDSRLGDMSAPDLFDTICNRNSGSRILQMTDLTDRNIDPRANGRLMMIDPQPGHHETGLGIAGVQAQVPRHVLARVGPQAEPRQLHGIGVTPLMLAPHNTAPDKSNEDGDRQKQTRAFTLHRRLARDKIKSPGSRNMIDARQP